MDKQGILKRAARALTVLGGVLFAGTACQDLHIVNEIDPDRERALRSAPDVEALIGGAMYPNMFRALQGSGGGLNGLIVNLFAPTGAESTMTMAGTLSLGWFESHLPEPRPRLNNAPDIPATTGPHGPRTYWPLINRVSSIAYDGLRTIEDLGLQMMEDGVDVTPRARAFAKFMQGWSWGYTALVFDQVVVFPESVSLDGDARELAAAHLRPYDQAIEASVASLEEAIAIAQQNADVVHFPSAEQSAFWFGTFEPVTNARFIEMANSLAARLLVLGPRTPQERSAVDWARVLQFTSNGVTADVEFQLDATRSSQLLIRFQNNTATGTSNHRWDYRAIGPADQSGSYQTWINSPPSQRDRFNIVTPDRRITGATPTTNGSYTRYRADNNGFDGDRGFYLRSAYQWARHAIRFGSPTTAFNTGTQPMFTVDENNLYRAEAILRTAGATQEALDLINSTRTREHLGSSLPPVTAAGVPLVDGACVPRKDNGDCGDLLTALRYERIIELKGIDAIRGYADSRGFGLLPDGSLIHFPVPGNELEVLGLPVYTFGGVGEDGGATYAPAEGL